MEIKDLLKESSNTETAEKIKTWLNDINGKIARGDLMIGILDTSEAQKIPDAYEKLVKCGDQSALEDLANWYVHPLVGDSDYSKAEKTYKKMIDLKIPGAKYKLAKFRWFYRKDELGKKDKLKTLSLLDEDVQQKLAEAFVLKGYMLADGFEGHPNVAEAINFFKEASEQGNPDAMFELYIYYATGNGVPQDDSEAYRHIAMAAEKGHNRAMYNMGTFHATGTNVEQDIERAVEWYKKASDAGNARAGFTLGVMYAMGNEIEEDLSQSQQYLDAAEENGYDPEAIEEIRELYLDE